MCAHGELKVWPLLNQEESYQNQTSHHIGGYQHQKHENKDSTNYVSVDHCVPLINLFIV